jgi:hypothetical protein
MVIFFRNIPGDTLHKELIAFIRPALKGGFFKAQGKITKINIVALKDKDINFTEYHALVTIEPDPAALRTIRKLHGQPFKGKRVVVREYVRRSWKNDRRLACNYIEDAPTKERRHNLTRRRNLEAVEEARPRFSSQKSFHRIY